MSRDDEDGGVSGVGLGLGVAAGAGATYVGDSMLSKNIVNSAIKGEEGVDRTIRQKVKSFFKNDKEGKKFGENRKDFKAFAELENPEKKLKIKEQFDVASHSSPELDAARKKVSDLQLQKQTLEANLNKLKNPQTNLRNFKVNPQRVAQVEANINALTPQINAAEAGRDALEKKAIKAHKGQKIKTDTPHIEDVSVKKLKGDKYQLSYTQNHVNEAGTAIGESTSHKITVDGVTGVKEGKVKAGKVGEVFEAFKPGVQRSEAEMTRAAVKGTGMNEFGQGLKFANNMGKGKVIAAAVGTAAVAYGIGNMMFPSHARRIDNERAANHDMGRS